MWSPEIWSPTMGPQFIGPSGQTVLNQCPIRSPWTDGPQKFGPHGQMVPNQFGPPGQMVPRIFCLSRGTGCGDPELRGPNWLGTICPGGPHFWGPFVQGDQIGWAPFFQGDRFYGDFLSRGTGSGEPEVWGSNGFGTKCVAVKKT